MGDVFLAILCAFIVAWLVVRWREGKDRRK